VPACAYNPFEAVQTNLIGAKNIIDAAIDQGAKQVLILSTDKAVNPANFYDATKLCAEKMFVQANSYTGDIHILAIEKSFRRSPELYDHPQLSATRMAARKLRWLDSGRLLDAVDDCGWHDLLQSLKIWPADSETRKLFARSCLGARGIKMLHRLSRLLH
jgi:hypothetical protein